MSFNLAILGVGTVGSEVIAQVAHLDPKYASRLKVTYISSSKKCLIGTNIPLATWQNDLQKSIEPPIAYDQLPQELTKSGGQVILVDNTSSDIVASQYPALLRAGIHVVTPNKKAYSSDLALYEDIQAASAESGAKFLNESTVGAGLPIISTLKDLVATGDKILKIEGVLSGTLSYIFNEYSTPKGGNTPFSTIVKIAREKGYTEPHPGDDLNGADVARKLTILSRLIPSLQSSLPEGYKSVSTSSLVPDPLADPSVTGDLFVQRLTEFDSQFGQLRAEAEREGKVLRYAGVIDVQTGEIRAALEMFSVKHAFATSLGGSDNIIAFHTERYSPRPLIVQGSGAGAAVTAMGVLSDILKLL